MTGLLQEKPRLTLAQIINMSVGFLGIQMAFGLQNASASRILSNFGANIDQLAWFWLVAPVTGLIVQPIIGHLGDNTWTFMGRRKPYFLIGAVFCAIGLVFLPNSSSVTAFMGANVLLLAVVFLAMMDASVNISMEPFRALVGDMLPKSQGTMGFSVQTILIGVGAVIGSEMPFWLTKLGVSNVAPVGFVPPNVVISFYVGAAVLLATILYTIFTTREYPPGEFRTFSRVEANEKKGARGFASMWSDLLAMPTAMRRLGWAQFFSWFALFTMWVYTTSAVATHQFGLSYTDTHSAAFSSAGDEVSHLFGLYNLFAIPFAFLLMPIAGIIGKKYTHALALLCGAMGLISMYFITNIDYLWISMLGVGFAWASILAMPYAILIESIPRHKMGIYMGFFNFFITIPQIVNGLLGGVILATVFHNAAIYSLMMAGAFMLLAAIAMLRIKEENETYKESKL